MNKGKLIIWQKGNPAPMVRGEYKEVQVWTDLGNKISIKSQVVTIKVTMLCYTD